MFPHPACPQPCARGLQHPRRASLTWELVRMRSLRPSRAPRKARLPTRAHMTQCPSQARGALSEGPLCPPQTSPRPTERSPHSHSPPPEHVPGAQDPKRPPHGPEPTSRTCGSPCPRPVCRGAPLPAGDLEAPSPRMVQNSEGLDTCVRGPQSALCPGPEGLPRWH